MPVKAGSRTIVVPDDYATIQKAIANANSGDTVFVRNGIYAGGIVIDKPISLAGEDTKNTIISGGIVMKGVSMKTRTGFVDETIVISSKTENQLKVDNLMSKPNVNLCNFVIPRTTVLLINSSDVSISGLTVKNGDNHILAYGDRIKITATKSGIHVVGSHEIITDNTGAVNCGGSFNLITRNDAASINIDGSSNIVSDNYVSGSVLTGGGWLVQVNGNSNVIANNTVINGQIGIHIENGSDNLVTGNCVEGNYFMGIHVFNGNNNRFYDNYVAYNQGPWDGWGISLSGTRYHAENNTFSGNTIMNNSHNIRVESLTYLNFWDNGQEGNYWGDYNGTDSNNDKLGDVSYIINNNNVDHYPLMLPREIPIPIAQGPFYIPPGIPSDSLNPSPPSNTSTSPAPTLPSNPSSTPVLPKSDNETEASTGTSIELFPATLVIAVSGASVIAVVVAGLLFYFRKRKRG